MEEIVAVLNNGSWSGRGFIFSTDNEEHVKHFMFLMHYQERDYYLTWRGDKPDGSYTFIEVEDIKNSNGEVINAIYKI